MYNLVKHRAEIIEHLEQAFMLCNAAGEPIASSLIKRALVQVRAAQIKDLPKLKDPPKPQRS